MQTPMPALSIHSPHLPAKETMPIVKYRHCTRTRTCTEGNSRQLGYETNKEYKSQYKYKIT